MSTFALLIPPARLSAYLQRLTERSSTILNKFKICSFGVLDDIGSNLKPARDMGMTTIKVTSAQQAIDSLEAVLNKS